MALLHQHVDIGPGLGHVVLHLDQVVVEHDRVGDDHQQPAQHDDGSDAHCSPPVRMPAAILYQRHGGAYVRRGPATAFGSPVKGVNCDS